MTPSSIRTLALLAVAAASPCAPAAAPAPFAIVADELDAGAPSASLPVGPVDQSLADLRRDSPQAVVLVPRREEHRAGTRYAYAAWRSSPDAPQWDALVVVALPEGARMVEATSTARDVEAALTALIAHALGSPAPAPVVAPAVVPAPLPPPERWDLRFVVLLETDPAWRAPSDPAALAALADAHDQYLLRLQHDGFALAAGPLVPGLAVDDREVGLLLLRVKDLATAARIAAADPAVAAGQLKATVREWRVPAGRLP